MTNGKVSFKLKCALYPPNVASSPHPSSIFPHLPAQRNTQLFLTLLSVHQPLFPHPSRAPPHCYPPNCCTNCISHRSCFLTQHPPSITLKSNTHNPTPTIHHPSSNTHLPPPTFHHPPSITHHPPVDARAGEIFPQVAKFHRVGKTKRSRFHFVSRGKVQQQS